MGLASDVQRFAEKLKRAEKAKEAKEKVLCCVRSGLRNRYLFVCVCVVLFSPNNLSRSQRETSARTGSGRGRVRAGRTASGSSQARDTSAARDLSASMRDDGGGRRSRDGACARAGVGVVYCSISSRATSHTL